MVLEGISPSLYKTCCQAGLILGNEQDIAVLNEYALIEVLRNKFRVNEDHLLRVLATHYGVETISLETLYPDPELVRKLSDEVAGQNIVPLFEDGDIICLAVTNPVNPVIGQLAENLSKNVQLKLISPQELNNYRQQSMRNKREGGSLLDELIREAALRKVSDIHIHAQADGATVSFRSLGKLLPVKVLSRAELKHLTALIKLHAHMDISLSTLPQDGRLDYEGNEKLRDIRVSTLPTIHGEDFVLRLFDPQRITANLAELGFSDQPVAILKEMLSFKTGLILVTGSTGSGKSTTLYSMLKYLQQQERGTIISLENPVESQLPGIRQSQVNFFIGYDFPRGLRAILRQDPDVIMIGEIRDRETAKTAVDAAFTGHLVLATLHTTNCAQTLARLESFDLDPFLICQTLRGVVSQKLCSALCVQCRRKKEKDTCWVSNGCAHCGYTGYSGRVVLSEILLVQTPPSAPSGDTSMASELMEKNRFLNMDEDIREKLSLGIVSPADIIKLN